MMMDYIAGKIIIMIFMSVCAYEDIRHKSVDIKVFITMGLCEFMWYMMSLAWRITPDGYSILSGMLIGVVIGIVSILTKESIGRGDALFYVLIGAAVGARYTLFMLIGSMVLACMYSLCVCAIGFIRRRNYRRVSFAFLPMAWLAGITVMIGGLVG